MGMQCKYNFQHPKPWGRDGGGVSTHSLVSNFSYTICDTDLKLLHVIDLGPKRCKFSSAPCGWGYRGGDAGQISRYTAHSHVVYQMKEHGHGNTAQGQFLTFKPMVSGGE